MVRAGFFPDQIMFTRLREDVATIRERDPAARSAWEVLTCYPGLHALVLHRFAHACWRAKRYWLARFVSQAGRFLTGIEIHPGATIGRRVFIDHGMGVVIGETAIIGERVRVYQAVTLGAKSFPADGEGALVKGNARHPIVEDDVVIYAGATILGRVTIGRGSVIGGNVWLTHSVPPGTSVAQGKVREGGSADKP